MTPLFDLSGKRALITGGTHGLVGPFIMAKYAGQKMIERGAGKIINICAMMSEPGRNTAAAYTAAKGGLKMLTRTLATEWGKVQ